MADPWSEIEESNLSDFSNYYSDEIDSDIEAELYSVIHHEECLANNHYVKKYMPESSEISNVWKMRETSPALHENIQPNVEKLLSIENDVSVDTRELLQTQDIVKQDGNRSDSSRKHKTDSDHNSLTVSLVDVCDSETNILSEQALTINHKNAENSSEDPISMHDNECIVIDSSDSDSIIFSEPECSSKDINLIDVSDTVSVNSGSSICSDKKAEVNIVENVDTVSNNSGDLIKVSISSPQKENNSLQDNIPVLKNEADKSTRDIWYVNNDDSNRPKKQSVLCHGRKPVQCFKCYKRGHTSKMCPIRNAVKCFICGEKSHLSSSCRFRRFYRSFKMGYDGQYCWRFNQVVCSLCRMQGHSSMDCPDIWRRYHLTTHPSSIVRGSVNESRKRTFYCFNCGRPGHFGSQCNFSRINSSMRTWPAVVSYDNPEPLLKRRLNNIMNRNSFDKDVFESNFETASKWSVTSQINAFRNNLSSNEQKLEHVTEKSSEQKLNVSQDIASEEKNTMEKDNPFEVKIEQTADNADGGSDIPKTEEKCKIEPAHDLPKLKEYYKVEPTDDQEIDISKDYMLESESHVKKEGENEIESKPVINKYDSAFYFSRYETLPECQVIDLSEAYVPDSENRILKQELGKRTCKRRKRSKACNKNVIQHIQVINTRNYCMPGLQLSDSAESEHLRNLVPKQHLRTRKRKHARSKQKKCLKECITDETLSVQVANKMKATNDLSRNKNTSGLDVYDFPGESELESERLAPKQECISKCKLVYSQKRRCLPVHTNDEAQSVQVANEVNPTNELSRNKSIPGLEVYDFPGESEQEAGNLAVKQKRIRKCKLVYSQKKKCLRKCNKDKGQSVQVADKMNSINELSRNKSIPGLEVYDFQGESEKESVNLASKPKRIRKCKLVYNQKKKCLRASDVEDSIESSIYQEITRYPC